MFCLNPWLEGQNLYDYFDKVVNLSNQNNRNINYIDGKLSQDLKRSTALMLRTEGSVSTCSCTLINTVKQEKTPYLLTAEHCLPKGLNEGSSFELFITFDYEVSDALDRGSDPMRSIARIYQVAAYVHFKDIAEDIALLRITHTTGKEDEFKQLMENAFASGWNNALLDNAGILNISHPRFDHKKVFINPQWSGIYRNRSSNEPQGYITKTDAPWNGNSDIGARPQPGSSGSGLFNNSYQLAGVLSGGNSESSWNLWNYNIFSHISNVWYGPGDKVTLQNLLDQDETWLTNIPGGYLKDLVPLDDLDFSLEIQPGETLSTPGVDPNDPTRISDNLLAISASNFYERNFLEKLISSSDKIEYWEKLMGLKLNTSSDSKIFLTVYFPDKDPNSGAYTLRLLYGGFANRHTPTDEFGFQIEGWDCNDPPEGYPPCNRAYEPYCRVCSNTVEDLSTTVKKSMINASSDWAIDLNRVITLTDLKVPIVVQLQNAGSEPVKVQTLSYPAEPPKNALQLFRPAEVKNRYRSYKYPESGGKESDDLFIQEVSIKEYDPDLPDIVSFDKTISTKNNGGYLNLINPNYKIGALDVAGGEDLTELAFEIRLKENHGKTFSYRVWIDFFNTDHLSGRNNSTFTYNFVYDPVPHQVEEIASGPGLTGDMISFTYRLPHFSKIRMAPDQQRRTRMRIAIKEGNQLPEQAEKFPVGEVEDYLIELVAPPCEELKPSDYETYAQAELPYCGEGNYRAAKETLADHYQEETPGSLTFNTGFAPDIPYATATGFRCSFEGRNKESISESCFATLVHETESGEYFLENGQLKMEVYYPVSRSEVTTTADLQALPVIIYAFGGGFVLNRDDEAGKNMCRWLASKGYVVAAIDYRLGMNITNGELSKRAIIRAWQDLRASVMYWRNQSEFNDGEHRWKVDPKKIYGVGFSAGAITVLHNLYLDQDTYESERAAPVFPEDEPGYLLAASRDYTFTLTNWSEIVQALRDVWAGNPDAINHINEVITQHKTYRTYDLDKYPTYPCIGPNSSCDPDNVPDQSTMDDFLSGIDGRLDKGMAFSGALAKLDWMTNEQSRQVRFAQHDRDAIVSIVDDEPFSYLGDVLNIYNFATSGTVFTPKLYGGRSMLGEDMFNFNGKELLGTNMAGGSIPYHRSMQKFIPSNKNEIEPKLMYYVDAFFTKEGMAATAAKVDQEVATSEALPMEGLLPTTAPLFNVFPNPATDHLNILMEVHQTGSLQIEIYDLQGKTVYELSRDRIEEGHQLITLRNLELASGTYVVAIEAGDLVRRENILIKRE